MVIVTGGGTGIGRATALACARRGAKVLITGRRAEPLRETEAAAPGIRGVTADVTVASDARRIVEEAVKGSAPVAQGEPRGDHQRLPTETPILSRSGLPEQIPVGRRGEPDDVADWMVALAPPGSHWLTGQVVGVDGGLGVA